MKLNAGYSDLHEKHCVCKWVGPTASRSPPYPPPPPEVLETLASLFQYCGDLLKGVFCCVCALSKLSGRLAVAVV